MDEGRDKAPVAVGEAYISGALTALDDAPRTRLFYEVLAEIAGSTGLRAYLPHRVSDPVAAAHLDPRAVYEIDRAHVTSAAVVIAYAGIPSFGVGIEVELAREHSVPVIIVAERDRPISRLLLGNPAVVEVVKFADLDGLRRALAVRDRGNARRRAACGPPSRRDCAHPGRTCGGRGAGFGRTMACDRAHRAADARAAAPPLRRSEDSRLKQRAAGPFALGGHCP